MTPEKLLLAAVLAQAALVLALLPHLGRHRLPSVKAGQIKLHQIALSSDAWPEKARQISNAVNNQFQLPLIFYVSVGVSIYLGANLLDVLVAWSFVVSRYIHAYIHITTNNVVRRFYFYCVGYFALILWWLLLVARLFGWQLGVD